ncbi:MAG: Folylpolyglutamate synthetase [Chrysothrix sp. TS-e1954]|nr:MAG: Folylpolyglutamate synthetase [Chrysothrix sp. TS-e1954]
MARDYAAAIGSLNTLQSNFAVVDAIRKSGRGMNKNAIPEMIEWTSRIGYKPTDFDRLNIIHVAGTKGKGSTSAFISSILSQHRLGKDGPHKIGLYTSPHLQSVRERIQINNQPISEESFARYFFEIWDRLERSAEQHGLANGELKPVYFRYLTLMAFHVYLEEGIDTAIFECGVGGEYDSTNIITRPTVCAVTSLDIDHVAMLGDTVEDIAWHKAGIFKQGSKCDQVFTVARQPGKAMDVLKQRATDVGKQLEQVQRHPEIEDGSIKLGLAADFQKGNASLAMAVVKAHVRAMGQNDSTIPMPYTPITDMFRRGLEEVKWKGRCQTIKEKKITWYIDGGHTLQSIRLAAEWFASCTSNAKYRATRRILIFNQQNRDASGLARALHAALTSASSRALDADPRISDTQGASEASRLFTHTLFCTNVTFADKTDTLNMSQSQKQSSGHYKPDLVSINSNAADVSNLAVQHELASTWQTLDPEATTQVHGTIQDAIDSARNIADCSSDDEEVAVFVTGSLHLVGGVLEVLQHSKT